MKMYRDDEEALLARLDALDRDLVERDARIADLEARAGDGRLAALEAEVARLRRELLDREATILELQRRHGIAVRTPPSGPLPAPNTPEARAEADRLLSEGVDRHRAGDRAGAMACFQRGLTLVPQHEQLHRALRRYT